MKLDIERINLLLAADALPLDQRVTEAAAALATLKTNYRQRRRDRRYTGVLDGRRRPVGQLVKLPTGQLAKLVGVIRGKAFVTWEDPECIHSTQLALTSTSNLTIVKNPAAVLLGSRKRGAKERPSARKAAACRRNGNCPVRPGSRPRGAPRRDEVTSTSGTS
jgi:hypothetical protein